MSRSPDRTRRRWGALPGLGATVVLALAAGGALAGGALAQEEPSGVTVPPPPVTSPPYEVPEGSEGLTRPGAPAASYACSTYASTAFTTEFVTGLLIPLVFAGVSGGGPPVDLRGITPYLQQLGQACGVFPPHLTPTSCANDDALGEQYDAMVDQAFVDLGQEALQPFVGFRPPTTGMVLDTLAAFEGSSASEASSTAPLFEALDCRTVQVEDVPFDSSDEPPEVGTAPAIGEPGAPPGGAADADTASAPPAGTVPAGPAAGASGPSTSAVSGEAPTGGPPSVTAASSLLDGPEWRWRLAYVVASAVLLSMLALSSLAHRFLPGDVEQQPSAGTVQ